MNYCSQCGGKVVLRVPAGDNRPRHVCLSCNAIHYSNRAQGVFPVHVGDVERLPGEGRNYRIGFL